MLQGRYCYPIAKEIKAVVPQLTCDGCRIQVQILAFPVVLQLVAIAVNLELGCAPEVLTLSALLNLV